MAQKITDLYLYLTRRDKTGVRILAKFQGRSQLATRIVNVQPFQLPTGWAESITQIIYDSRMLWEPWIQSADTFDILRNSLKVRGYKNIPVNPIAEFAVTTVQTSIVNLSSLPAKKTMLRKK